MRVCSAALAMPKSASLVVAGLLGEQQVAGLHVAVHHAGAVGVVEPVAGVAHDARPSRRCSSCLRSRSMSAHGRPVHVLHDDVVAVRCSGPGPSRTPARCSGAGAARPTAPRGGSGRRSLVVGQVLGEQLHRDRPLEHGVVRHGRRSTCRRRPGGVRARSGRATSVGGLTSPSPALLRAAADPAAVAVPGLPFPFPLPSFGSGAVVGRGRRGVGRRGLGRSGVGRRRLGRRGRPSGSSVGVVLVSVFAALSSHSCCTRSHRWSKLSCRARRHVGVHVVGHRVDQVLDLLLVRPARSPRGCPCRRPRCPGRAAPRTSSSWLLRLVAVADRDRLALLCRRRSPRRATARAPRAPARICASDALTGRVNRRSASTRGRPASSIARAASSIGYSTRRHSAVHVEVSSRSHAARGSPSRGWPTPPGLTSQRPSDRSLGPAGVRLRAGHLARRRRG